jgi:hypothetical protein
MKALKFSNAHCVGPYTFGSFEAWGKPGLRPAVSEATKLLQQLAADPGIVSVMKQNRWGVGKLSEMPPEGKVGFPFLLR